MGRKDQWIHFYFWLWHASYMSGKHAVTEVNSSPECMIVCTSSKSRFCSRENWYETLTRIISFACYTLFFARSSKESCSRSLRWRSHPFCVIFLAMTNGGKCKGQFKKNEKKNGGYTEFGHRENCKWIPQTFVVFGGTRIVANHTWDATDNRSASGRANILSLMARAP